MSPKLLLECLRLTYHLDYARQKALEMVDAAYPGLSEEDRLEYAGHLMLPFSEWKPSVVSSWTLDAAVEFINAYDQALKAGNLGSTGYMVVEEMLNLLAMRIADLTPSAVQVLPHWFRPCYLRAVKQRQTVGEAG